MAEDDFYDLLGVDRSADDKAIKAAFRKAAMECHPDRHGGCTDREAKFKALNEAYDCLKDPQKRAAYDRFGKAAFQNGGSGPFGGGGGAGGPGFEGFSDVFSSIFGDFMDPRGQRQNAARGADLRYDLELTLEESYSGKSATIEIETLQRCEPCGADGSRGTSSPQRCATCGGVGKVRAQQGFFVVERGCPACHGHGVTVPDPCPSCEGEGRILKRRTLSIDVPAGVDEGTRIRVAGEGEAGIRGAPGGDLYLFVHLKRHAIFSREGTTLVAECPISFTTAALGGTMTLCGIDGNPIEIKIPAGIQSGEMLRQRGFGMSVLSGRGRGDLVTRVLVETPSRLSARQKELLAEFRETETGDECPASRSFFARIKEALGR